METNNAQPFNPSFIGVVIVTGGLLGGASFAPQINSTSTSHTVEINRTSPSLSYRIRTRREQAPFTAMAVLNGLQDRFGLSVSQLAQITHATRPTIYGWLKNSGVQRDDKANRLSELMAVVEVCDRGDIDSKSISRLLRRPTKLGSSMLELLSEPKLDVATIKETYLSLKADAQTSIASMQRMATKRKTLAAKYTPEEMGDNLSQLS